MIASALLLIASVQPLADAPAGDATAEEAPVEAAAEDVVEDTDADESELPDYVTVPDDVSRLPLTRTIEAVFELDGATTIALSQDSGGVELVAADRDDIAVTLELESVRLLFFSNRRTTWAIHQAEVEATREEEGRLALGVAMPVRIDDDWLEAHWTIEVPRHMAVDLENTAGRLVIRGVTGGVRAEVVSGGIRVDVPSGALDLKTVSGGISARVAEPAYGALDMSVTSGSIELRIDGEEIDTGGFGGDVSREGPVGPDHRLRTTSGSIDLVLGDPRP